ncbi:PTS sugar transporter subunit IIC/EAL domain-containing protein [Vibrio sp. TRT 21S02]|uniref:PTS sugar transporter subunit IIC/EAL domain-containing protein n=1 Tax=Vibrio sp. TRT 21S02 TaxID=3418507 RepID=UPI003CFB89E7
MAGLHRVVARSDLGIKLIYSRYIVSSLKALREGMIWLVPCLMISSFALFFACVGEFLYGYRTETVTTFYDIHSVIARFFPYLMTSTISYVLAMQWRLPRPPVALLSVLYLVIIGEILPTEQTVLTFNIIMAILTPLYAIPFLAYLLRFNVLQLTRTESAGQIVKESLNLVLPAILTAGLVLVVNYSLLMSVTQIPVLELIFLDYANEPTWFGVMFAAFNSTLWFFGIHGYYALLPMVDLLQEASNLNYSTVLAGGAGQYHMNLSFMGAFVFIGGAGSTLSLVIALLLFAKQKSLKMIALASIPIGLININEILLFGLPIIFNPRLFIPFLLAPIVNVVVAMMAVSLELVASPSVSVPFNSPILINAWMSTSGDWGAVVLQLINLFLGVLIYLPSVRRMNLADAKHAIHLRALDTTYSRREEEAKTLMDDPIFRAMQKERETHQVEQQLQQLSHTDFCIEYQPKVSRVSGKTVGCEALIRAKNEKGSLLYPGQFMPWLEKAGLMKDVDLWVIKQVVRDISYMQMQGIYLPVSVNITAATLNDNEYMEQLCDALGLYGEFIQLEITEESLLLDEKQLALVFNQLHQLGVEIHIDDFGTGFSSLSYLNKFEIDAIKIDRSFVLALEHEKGLSVFTSILAIADKLELNVVVEGVESQEQLQYIPANDSIAVQGWHYSKSLPLEKFTHYVLF